MLAGLWKEFFSNYSLYVKWVRIISMYLPKRLTIGLSTILMIILIIYLCVWNILVRGTGWSTIQLLLFACFYGLVDVVVWLLDTAHDPNCTTASRDTPLHFAAMNRNHHIVSMLLDKEGVDVNARNDDGFTPLSSLAREDDEKLVQTLLRNKRVNADCRERHNRTPLPWAVMSSHEKGVEMLLETRGGCQPQGKRR